MGIFAERLRELRGTESQASFAALIGINRVQYAKYETGQNSPSVNILERICRIHACSADWLLGLRDSATPRETNIKTGDNSPVAIGNNITQTVGTSKKQAAKK